MKQCIEGNCHDCHNRMFCPEYAKEVIRWLDDEKEKEDK